MSTRKKPRNFFQRLPRRIWRLFSTVTKSFINWVLRSLMVFKRRSRQSQAGFVLPTVVMVLLVVALLTTAIVIRSFDRAKNASNYRIDQAVLNAAAPAIDRARAKIERLFSPDENRLAGNTPPEDGPSSISEVLSTPQYTFGDETQLKLAYTPSGGGATQTLDTAWKFPLDTDNNGKFDSFTLYGIYYRNPKPAENRARTPLEARALPQATGEINTCAAGNSASSGGIEGWYETDGQLKKAFFTYVATVPISQADIAKVPASQQAKYEAYKGNKGFSALEMQQDQARISLDNNAVWFDDDLSIANVPPFKLNGRVHTNSNLMVANNEGDEITFYQVSSVESCFYKAVNGKMIIGGNVAAGDITGNTAGSATDSTEDLVKIHLYQGKQKPYTYPDQSNVQVVNADNKTTTLNPPEVASNSNAYAQRLDVLVQGALYLYDTNNPSKVAAPDTASVGNAANRFPQKEVVQTFNNKYNPNDPASARKILTQVLKSYFADRLRRVSYKEVPFGGNALTTTSGGTTLTAQTVFAGTTGDLRPPKEWTLIDPTYSQVTLKTSNGGIELEATNPNSLLQGNDPVEKNIGDRIVVGNALPNTWLKPDGTTYANHSDKDPLNVPWNDPFGGAATGAADRYRKSQVDQLDDLGDTSRGGFWEQAAAKSGTAAVQYPELSGGLRVVTGAGIYVDNVPISTGGMGVRTSSSLGTDADKKSFLPEPPTVEALIAMSKNDTKGIKLPKEILDNQNNPTALKQYTVVWPDTMPMYRWDKNGTNLNAYETTDKVYKGDLQMRATVVYHYAVSKGPQQEPIACVSSYYDPTNPDTAQNATGLPQNPEQKPTALGMSNNGVNYSYSNLAGLRSSAASNPILQRQANMLLANGRWANEPLKRAFDKFKNGGLTSLSLDDIAAIDAANCALNILKGGAPAANSLVPDFTIQERAFLDARQVKALHKRETDTDGNLLKRLDPAGSTTLVNIDRQTLLPDIGDPAKVKIAELGSLTQPGAGRTPEYSLPIEQRQPLEIRVTQLDLDQLRQKAVGGNTGGTGVTNNQEYMLPNSGIIYASRDDALPDISALDFTNGYQSTTSNETSGTDFQLDPTRRPNGIRLVNGANLARDNNYRTAEKGLILASDLPVYIKGDSTKGGFNLHVKPGTDTVREEFIEKLRDDYSNFYTRSAGTNGDGFDQGFACRPSNAANNQCGDGGDQWRPARILSDAVTLLSRNFRDGYRSEGDYDLNNNVGNLAVEAYLKNGFWWNNFATTAPWYDTAGANAGYPKADFRSTPPPIKSTQPEPGSSYVTNAVTPIQRRTNFRQYLMEACTKKPVSACGPQDWFVGQGKKSFEVTDLTAVATNSAGTTAQLPTPTGTFKSAARRVAFKRNQFGTLEVPDTCKADTPADLANCKATPIGVNGTNATAVTYGNPATLPPAVDNALWYATTTDTTNSNPTLGISYNRDNTLYYRAYDPEALSERQLLLPGIPELPKDLLSATTPSLNGPIAAVLPENDPSDYGMCTVAQTSKSYKLLSGLGAACDPTVIQRIQAVRAALINLAVTSLPASVSPFVYAADLPATATTLTAKAKVNIYTLPYANPNPNLTASVPPGTWTLDRGDQLDPIFIFRANANHGYMNLPGVNLNLNGVDPNNILWVSTGAVYINIAAPNRLAGTFLGLNTQPFDIYGANSPANLQFNGRILGFSGLSNRAGADLTSSLIALTTAAQPILLPVLQLHSPQGTPNNPFTGESINGNYWIQRATSEEIYNAVFIMGDSPSRPFPTNPANKGETGGGLPNFPRFLEAWEPQVNGNTPDTQALPRVNNKITGGFIQFKKSAFASAPFESIDDPTKDNSLFFDNNPITSATPNPAYMAAFNFTDYRYKGGAQQRKAPYYRPPERRWGYDVGLLSQTPDLFARRFASPSAGTPNEYFRQVNRDDRWIQTLLCASQPQGTTYVPAIADPSQRPSSCTSPPSS